MSFPPWLFFDGLGVLCSLSKTQLKKTLPTVEQDIAELEAAKLIPKPKHLTNEQWDKWIEGTNQMIEIFTLSHPFNYCSCFDNTI